MKLPLFDFLFGEHPLPNSTKGLKEMNSLKPSLHSDEASLELTVGIDYRLVRAKRKSVGFIVDERGLTVRAPRWVSRQEIETMIYEREGWIREKLDQFSALMAKKALNDTQFVDGQSIPYLGGMITICLKPQARSVALEGQNLQINRPLGSDAENVKACVLKWLKNEARRYLGTRLEAKASEAGLDFECWKLSGAKGRWGCCTSARTIRLNWRLIHLNPELIDYVIAHELAHLDEMNHGPRFWARVSELCPDYLSRRTRLKKIHISQLPF